MTTPIAPRLGSADLAVVTDYLAHALSQRDARAVESRLRDDAEFRAAATPLIVMWRLPVRLRELVPPPLVVRRRRWPYALGGLAVVPVLVLWFSWYLVNARVTLWDAGAAGARAGRALPMWMPGSAPTVWETKPGETRSIETYRATVTLGSSSRFSIGTSGVGAVDGEAKIVVPAEAGRKTFGMMIASVPCMLTAGRYHVSHPLGDTTRIVVDSGRVWLNFRPEPVYRWPLTLTFVQQDTITAVTAVSPDGRSFPLVTVKNYANNPFVSPTR
jgi:hypothetical protein